MKTELLHTFAARVGAGVIMWDLMGYFKLFSFSLNVCVSAGEVDDVLDSVCVVHHSRDGHRFAPIMVSLNLTLTSWLSSILQHK